MPIYICMLEPSQLEGKAETQEKNLDFPARKQLHGGTQLTNDLTVVECFNPLATSP